MKINFSGSLDAQSLMSRLRWYGAVVYRQLGPLPVLLGVIWLVGGYSFSSNSAPCWRVR
ncbi:hypothetical protein O1V64_04465 [Rouxiella badensis]|nr:hypothetical protein O1V64_04465 [Rouxiella badensis]